MNSTRRRRYRLSVHADNLVVAETINVGRDFVLNLNVEHYRICITALEDLQHRVGLWNGDWDASLLEQLRSVQSRARNQCHALAPYTTLLLAYFFLKAGPQRSWIHRELLWPLFRLAEHRSAPESQPAKWLSGRIFFSWSAFASTDRVRYRFVDLAYKLFSGITYTSKLKMAVLLPGALQELPDRYLSLAVEAGSDPLVTTVDIANRYCATSALRLASLGRFENTGLLGRAADHCRHVQESHEEGTRQAMNANLCSVVTNSILYERFQERDRAKPILVETQKIEDQIGRAQAEDVLPEVKCAEWLSTTSAVRAVVAGRGSEHSDAIDAMRKTLKRTVFLFNEHCYRGLPDFIFNDPMYEYVSSSLDPRGYHNLIEELEACIPRHAA
jgi:hypothetical protein